MNKPPIRLGLVGIGKIARDQHLPAIAAGGRFLLVATASPHATLLDTPNHADIDALLRAGHDLHAVSLCTPPSGRFGIAAAAIDAGLHVMLEKPPGATVSEVVELVRRARAAGVTLFATWHSRETAGVDAARAWLATRSIRSVAIEWREDIRVWHPGQGWILAAGGFGVFDPGINALSIATTILPEALRITGSALHIPANRGAPIAASLAMTHGADTPVTAEFDFLRTGPQSWDITVDTDNGVLRLTEGGRRLTIDVTPTVDSRNEEYPRLYQRFADLIAAGDSDVDLRPLQLVADAFLLGRTIRTAPVDF